MRNKIKHPFKFLFSASLCWGMLAVASAQAVTELQDTNPVQLGSEAVRADQRDMFLQAERLIERRQFTQAREKMLQLSDYPLLPYLEVALLEQNFSLANEPVVLEFFNEFTGTPAERQLRTAWLQYLVRRNDGERFLRDYRWQNSTHLQCFYLREKYRALQREIRDGASDGILEPFWNEVSDQWRHGRSLPSACDPVFAAWANAGQRTDQIVWERILLALNERQQGLARYLTRFMDDETRYLADLMRRVHATPNTIRRFQEFPGKDEREREIVLYGLNRIRWTNHNTLVEVWEHFRDRYAFTPAERGQMESDIAVTLALRGDPRAKQWFEGIDPADMSDTARQWYLAAHLNTRNFQAIARFTDRLPPDVASRAQWQYWAARAKAELGHIERALELMEQAAQQRNYYGFLASARLTLMPSLQHEEPEFHPEALHVLAQQPAAQRAYELRQLSRFMDARREWNHLRSGLTEEERVLPAILASEWGWYDQAIFAFAQSGTLNDVHRRFPLAFSELLTENAQRASIDPAWVFAITRRESSFQVDAVSPAGARGLMQIMPGTAEYLQRGAPGPNPRVNIQNQLFNPEDNVRLGTTYLAELLRRTDDNWLLATAAYNAGIHRMQEWLPEESVAADMWVEMIPFQETRDYVKAVLAYQQIYAMLLGKDVNVLAPMVRMQINGGRRG